MKKTFSDLCARGLGFLPMTIFFVILAALLYPLQTLPDGMLASAVIHGLLVSLMAWYLIYGFAVAAWQRAKRAMVVVSVLAVVTMAFATAATVHFVREFHSLPTAHHLCFVATEALMSRSGSARSIVFAKVDVELWLIWVVVLVLIGAIWFSALRFAPRRPLSFPLGRRHALVGGALVCEIVVLNVYRERPQYVLMPDADGMVSFIRSPAVCAEQLERRLHTPNRDAVAPVDDAGPRPHVVLLLHESLRVHNLAAFGYGRPTTPWMSQFVESQPGRTILFENAIAVSSNTAISVPSTFNGLPMDASSEEFHRAPLLWQYAEAAGYRTLLLSAQSYAFQGLDTFLLSDPPRTVWTADGVQWPIVNGGGMDDEIWLEEVALPTLRDALRGDSPVFAILQFNATHYPVLEAPEAFRQFGDDLRGRYDNSVLFLDDLNRRVFDLLEREQALANTMVIMTADHGENLEDHPVHRTMSYYDEVLRVPLWIYLPPAVLNDAWMAENRQRLVSNLDILPTVLDAMQILDTPAIAPHRQRFGGQSLLRSVPDRTIMAANTGAIRYWTNESFALLRGRQKVIVSDWFGTQFFDRAIDPEETHDLWDEVSVDTDHWAHSALQHRHE